MEAEHLGLLVLALRQRELESVPERQALARAAEQEPVLELLALVQESAQPRVRWSPQALESAWPEGRWWHRCRLRQASD
jgi:hypothetical protein